MLFFKRYGKLSDAELVALSAEGDSAAFREILTRHQAAVHGFAYRFLGDEAEAADIAQETFLRLYRMAGTYTPDAKLRTFVLRIAKNLCIDATRKKQPMLMEELPEVPVEAGNEERISQKRGVQELEAAIRKLPDQQRMAVVLRHGEGLKYAEIAQTMNTTISAVESLLVRARKTLRGQLAVTAQEL